MSGRASDTLAATPQAVDEHGFRFNVRLHEIMCDLPYLFGRASQEGHEVGQRLATEVQEKMRDALTAAQMQQKPS